MNEIEDSPQIAVRWVWTSALGMNEIEDSPQRSWAVDVGGRVMGKLDEIFLLAEYAHTQIPDKAEQQIPQEVVDLIRDLGANSLRLVASVEAVLEIHKPYADDPYFCDYCLDGDASAVQYPCPTVAAIRTALGETE